MISRLCVAAHSGTKVSPVNMLCPPGPRPVLCERHSRHHCLRSLWSSHRHFWHLQEIQRLVPRGREWACYSPLDLTSYRVCVCVCVWGWDVHCRQECLPKGEADLLSPNQCGIIIWSAQLLLAFMLCALWNTSCLKSPEMCWRVSEVLLVCASHCSKLIS